jgi:hypothetical protein
MPEDGEPIPRELVGVFRNAIVAADDWRGGRPEPLLTYGDRHDRTVWGIAELVTRYEGVTPDDIDLLLRRLAQITYRERPADRSYAEAGKCLMAIYDEVARQRKRRGYD